LTIEIHYGFDIMAILTTIALKRGLIEAVERETRLELATACLEGKGDKRREPLASFLSYTLLI